MQSIIALQKCYLVKLHRFEEDKIPNILMSTGVKSLILSDCLTFASVFKIVLENMTKSGQDKYKWYLKGVKKEGCLFFELRIIKSSKLQQRNKDKNKRAGIIAKLQSRKVTRKKSILRQVVAFAPIFNTCTNLMACKRLLVGSDV